LFLFFMEHNADGIPTVALLRLQSLLSIYI